MKRKAPTGVIQMLFTTKEEAQKTLTLLIEAKAKKGYVQTNQDNQNIGDNNESRERL